jgi:hypothetical protein
MLTRIILTLCISFCSAQSFANQDPAHEIARCFVQNIGVQNNISVVRDCALGVSFHLPYDFDTRDFPSIQPRKEKKQDDQTPIVNPFIDPIGPVGPTIEF